MRNKSARCLYKLCSIAMLVVVFATLFSGCSGGKKTSMPIVANSDYDEQVFAKEVASVKTNNVEFAKDGICNFDIFYPDEIDDLTFEEEKVIKADRYKVELANTVDFFANAIKEIVGDEVKTFPLSQYKGGNNAIVLKVDATLKEVNKQGYFLKIASNEIVIAGKTLQGISNGIYSFLEDYLGCMFVSADFDYLPSLATINFKAEEKTFNPAFMWREVYSHESGKRVPEKSDGSDYLGWYSKLKLNGTDCDDWGNWCHTFYQFIPPKEYFEEHPEYFSEYNGKRKFENGPVSGQLCLTNEDVYKIITTKLFDMMEKQPDKHYWDVSQMDSWESRGTGCRCDNCKALDKKYDSPMGSLLTFINRIADECATRFPENFISTLAYNYSAVTPKNIVPRDNVIIKLCLMPGDAASDYKNPTSKHARAANKLVTDWGKIAKNILIWDYNVDFSSYLMPFPVYTPMKENNNFYLENNVYGIFHQMDYDKGGDNAELSAYLFAKLMWDKNTDVQATMSKYLEVYYGKASDAMAEYYDTISENLYKANKNLYLYSKPFYHSLDYLSPWNADKYLDIFAKAEKLADKDQVLLDRIAKVKVGALFVKADQLSADTKGRLAALEEMVKICRANGIDSMYEGGDGDNEIETYYVSQTKVIKAAPWIICGIVLAIILVVGGIPTLIIVIVKSKIKKSKRKTIEATGKE